MPGILFDLDGVFYVGDKAVPGARETLDWVQTNKIPHCFLTNTTSKPRSDLVDKLDTLGLTTAEDLILTPPVAARQWITTHLDKPVSLFVPPATEAEFNGIPSLARNTTQPVGAIVVGDLGDHWDYATLNQAFRLLMQDPKPSLIALGMTRYWRAPDGLRLDVAPFINALQCAADVEPLVLGKPAAPFFQAALEMVSCPPEETVMIGDDIRSDIGAAQAIGIDGILVETGKYQPSDLDSAIQPSSQIPSIADLPAWWRRQFPG
jgi:phospholysine phosphohistidine inorganic pyrophosphate phosphatase